MEIIQLTEDIHQEMQIGFEGDFITLELKFIEGCWFANLSYKSKTVNGIRLSSGVLLFKGWNFPFEMIIDDKGLELDSFSLDSFTSGTFDLILLNRAETESIRGYIVE